MSFAAAFNGCTQYQQHIHNVERNIQHSCKETSMGGQGCRLPPTCGSTFRQPNTTWVWPPRLKWRPTGPTNAAMWRPIMKQQHAKSPTKIPHNGTHIANSSDISAF
eukprot:2647223-Amphidinium_carterae.2